MIKKKVQDELNKQINEELYSAYLYYGMSAYFNSINLPGFANWMKKQAGEEIEHAERFYNFIFERGGDVELDALKKPAVKWKSPLDAFKAAYDHECHITSRIHFLVELAKKEKDQATENMLQWFVNEQVEEEAQTDEIVKKLKMIGPSTGALFMLDHKLGERKGD